MPPATSSSDILLLSSSDPSAVREWLAINHRKQLILLDKFLMELRIGRLSRPASASSSSTATSNTKNNPQRNNPATDRRVVVHRTVELLRHLIGSTKWNSAAQLLFLLRGLGRELHAAGGFREPAIGNVVRRIMAAVREEAVRVEGESNSNLQDSDSHLGMSFGGNTSSTTTTSANYASTMPETSGRLSLQSMLWALPQHLRPAVSTRSLSRSTGDHQRQESFASEADLAENDNTKLYPPLYYNSRPDLKQAIMEAITELMTDLEDLHKNISDQAVSHIHAGEIILTSGRSKTTELFLKAAAAKKRHFQVVVCEGAPHYGGHELAASLAEAGIDTIVIHDSALFAVMARVNKVLLPAHAVLANGGLIASSGCNLVALAAHYNSVPVVCVTGMFKLCPMYPHEGQDTLNELVSPSSLLDYSEMIDPRNGLVEFVNPIHDYIKPEHINLYVTNVGSFQPSFIYRLLAEYYHTDDWESFE